MINFATSNPPLFANRQNSLSFKGNSKNSYYNNFEREMKEAYGEVAFEEILNSAMADSGNKIGEGGEKVVYQIPFIDNFLVARIKEREHQDAPIREAENFSGLEYNFGQPIATNGGDVIIMQRVNGESYSVDNWLFTFIGAAVGQSKITEKQAKNFLAQIEKVSTLPVSSYVSLAKQVKCLSKNEIKMDCFNPNNLLMDWDKKEINHIDIMEGQERFSELERPLNSVHDMINLLCDAFLNLKYMDALDEEDAKRLKEATSTVIKKSNVAANIAGLSKDNENIKEACRISDETSLKSHNLPPLFVDAYSEFENFYDKDLHPKAKEITPVIYRYHTPYVSKPKAALMA